MSEMENIDHKVKLILIEKLGILPTQITDEANFVKDLGVDSLDYAELVLEFEQSFDIKITDQDAESLTTIAEAVSFIANKLDQKNE